MQKKQGFRTRAVFLILVWILMLVLSLALLSVLATFLNRNSQSLSVSSLSWAGYIIEGKSNNHLLEVTGVNACWVVPQVNASAGDGYSSAWIGIGDQLDKSLIQIGTEHDVVRERVSYDAWYELLPDFAVRLPKINVSPGDTMIASINLVNSNTDEWSIQISDATTGQAFNRNVVYNSTLSSGEWVLERPTIHNQTSALDDFGSVTFTDCFVKANNASSPIAKFSLSEIQMTNSQNVKLTTVSALAEDGASFTVSYNISK